MTPLEPTHRTGSLDPVGTTCCACNCPSVDISCTEDQEALRNFFYGMTLGVTVKVVSHKFASSVCSW